MERITNPKTLWDVLGKVYNAVYRLQEIENILGDDYDLERLKELVEADSEGRALIIPIPENDKTSDYLEPMKIGYALKSEIMKMEYRLQNKPKDISPLDYTVIECLSFALEKMKERGK